MSEEFRPVEPSSSGYAPQPRRNRTLIIIILLVLFLCCCCVVALSLGWTFGDSAMEYLGIY